MAGRSATADGLRERSSYRHWLRMELRYADLDSLGHVNNSGLPLFFEQTRCELIYPLLHTAGREHLNIVLARIEIDYLRELRYPGYVEIGTRVSRIGTKSLTLRHGVFANGGGECVGTGEAVIVIFDLTTRSSIPVPDDVRASLGQWQMQDQP